MDYDILPETETRAILQNFKPWPRPSIEAVRNAVLDNRFVVLADEDDEDTRLLHSMAEAFEWAVKGGRLFDLGHLPNDVIRRESKRAIELFHHGHIGHPFREAYAFFHSWDANTTAPPEWDKEKAAAELGHVGALYVVDPMGGLLPPDMFRAAEAEAVLVFDKPTLVIGTLVYTTVGEHSYGARIVRAHDKFGAGLPGAASSTLDAIMSCLLLLATDGIEVATIPAPDKLNKQRIKRGRPAIPAHYQVKAGPYVTALQARAAGHRPEGGESGGHASPIPHIRRGHLRHLHERHGASTIWVRDALVNLKDPDAPLARAFYQSSRTSRATRPISSTTTAGWTDTH
jgi:hypothetical protein